MVECPACGFGHFFDAEKWDWNGDEEFPTFTPDIKVAYKQPNGRLYVCHSRVTKGNIQFLSDSTHSRRDTMESLKYVIPPANRPGGV